MVDNTDRNHAALSSMAGEEEFKRLVMALPNEKIANEIYDVLVMCGGALDDERNAFIQAHTAKEYPCDEWRFGGHFRFGGKFYSSDGVEHESWRAGYHPDDFANDKNEEVYHSLMVAMNVILRVIWDQWKAGKFHEG